MKRKIKKLFQGNREDMIIACSLLVANYNYLEFLEGWKNEIIQDRPCRYFNGLKRWQDNHNTFYYKISNEEFIACSPGCGVCFTRETYIEVPIIEHI